MMEVAMSSSSGATELSPEEERVLIRDIAIAAESNSKEGDTFYLITQKWWQYWITYVNQDHQINGNDGSALSGNSDSPGSSASKRPAGIDNSDLISDAALGDSSISIEIQDSLLEGRDYVLLPQEVWSQLYSWYGGGPALERKAISSGFSQTELTIEVYPLRLKLLVMPKSGRSTIRISRKETIGELHRRACEIFDLNSEQVYIWDYYGHQKHVLMNDLDKTLDDAGIQMDQDILVEVLNNVNGTALGRIQDTGYADKESLPLEPSKSTLSIAGGKELDSTYGSIGVTTRGATCGLTGLINLGNTCFMNSAIQCLVHTPEFASYFQEDYHQEINRQNPLGMVGELALAFGDLLRRLWTPGRTPITPRSFKNKLSRFAPQFSGNNQHDSQELLAFLLDGLHEDLNRVKQKPYVNSRDADGRPDVEVADEYWANHIARNNSIIVDVCQGQYKSTLVCPVCNKVSVTFDPFMYLSLPLQSTTTRSITVTLFPCNGTLPSTCTVTVPKQGRCRDLIQAISNYCFLQQGDEIRLAEIKNHLIQRFLDDPLISLSTIKDDDHLAAYKMQKSAKGNILLQLIHRRQERESSNTQQGKPFGTPLISSVSLEDGITGGKIQKIVQSMISPLLKKEVSKSSDNKDSSFSGAATKSCENGAVRSPTDDASNSMNIDSDCSKDVTVSKLPLRLVDENNAQVDLTARKEKTIKLSSTLTSLLVYLDWSPELMNKYNTYHFENSPEVCKYGPVVKKARNEPLSLYTCLEAFLREEPLVPEDMWYCPQCQEQRQASKKLDLWRLPEVLVIHLKRFSYSRSMKHKLETFVNFPIRDFDLTNYVVDKRSSKRQLYELYALTNHYGSMGSGHYTAHIKLLDENKWYNFDDSHISPINEDDVKSSAAYVLFYRRVKPDASTSNGA